ncbi:Re1-silencing transcription factor [Plakobranchus ocellatus]|uniref:Re1-silencing transcription factor n=1 Tax=Plakobranchus ocellatus TaxID=259542 RepID=A0AAV4CU96_9GAST|nr:Re1-silencing transcription factor [Plakobranchus ocellatus]
MSLRLQTSKENVFSTSLAGTESPSSLRYCCHLCPSVLHNEFFFRLHLGTHEGFTCTSVISSASDVLLCTICGYIASDRNDYVQHIFRHPMERPFACSQCDVDAHRKRDLLTHIRTSHKEHPDQQSLFAGVARQNDSTPERLWTQNGGRQNHYSLYGGRQKYFGVCLAAAGFTLSARK